jgi:transglutaminase-like putative cysteine protease
MGFEQPSNGWISARGRGQLVPVAPAAACLLVLGCGLLWGCAALGPSRGPEADDYERFLRQNMAALDQLYTDEYEPVEFVVDTDGGSERIQALIDPQTVAAIADALAGPDLGPWQKIGALHRFVQSEFAYEAAPLRWARPDETLVTRRGDCKSLSLLLLSLLLRSGLDAHAAIGNGHMWVSVQVEGRRQVLETDRDPQRSRTYGIPGFYDRPLYKIYRDVSLKRKRRPTSGS